MANIIQQFQDADGNNIYPIAYTAGGAKLDLLWTNPSPTSGFSAQTISLNLSDYDCFLISSKIYDSGGNECFNFAIKGSTSTVLAYKDNSGPFTLRNVDIDNSGVTFSTGYVNSGSATNNGYLIPLKIYGIKMSYIVPTTVQGLQYVEVD